MPELPPIIARYFDAMHGGDAEALAAVFAPDATVTDEGQTHHGRAEIVRWRESANARYRVTVTPESLRQGDAQTVVTALVEGDFPKAGLPDPLRLDYLFGLADGLVSSLAIGLPR